MRWTLWKCACGKSSHDTSATFFLRGSPIKVHWVCHLCVCGPSPLLTVLQKPPPLPLCIAPMFSFIYLWREEAPSSARIWISREYYFYDLWFLNSEDGWMGNARNHYSSRFANLAVNTETPVPHPKDSALPGPVRARNLYLEKCPAWFWWSVSLGKDLYQPVSTLQMKILQGIERRDGVFLTGHVIWGWNLNFAVATGQTHISPCYRHKSLWNPVAHW